MAFQPEASCLGEELPFKSSCSSSSMPTFKYATPSPTDREAYSPLQGVHKQLQQSEPQGACTKQMP
eukprot:420552-Pleurochrysis_carterae.AAC.3